LQYLIRRRNFNSVSTGASLEEVAKLLVQKGCHRVPVVDGNGQVVNIVSQSALVKFLDVHKAELGAIGKHTVAHSMCGTSPVLKVTTANNVFDAFRIIAANDIMGIAVIDESGKFVGNTSASDLKEFFRKPATSLKMPVMDFLSHIRQQNLKSVHPAIHVTPSDTLAHVIGRLAATKIHRIFVCNKGMPISVISLSDILKYAYLVTLLKGDEME
jgi:CBS domain-containing protein